MRDDQDFNINFVQLVEQHPCLYDHTLPDYHRTRTQDQAWIAIGNEIKENGTYLFQNNLVLIVITCLLYTSRCV